MSVVGAGHDDLRKPNHKNLPGFPRWLLYEHAFFLALLRVEANEHAGFLLRPTAAGESVRQSARATKISVRSWTKKGASYSEIQRSIQLLYIVEVQRKKKKRVHVGFELST